MTKKRTLNKKKRLPSKSSKLPYRVQERLISTAELRFLHTGLQPAVGERFYIGVQTPMTSVLKVPDEHWDKAAGLKIRQKRIDFVLAYPKTFRIAAVIELDDRSHERADRKKRDRFVERSFDAAGVLLIRFPIFKKYDPVKIRSIIHRELRQHRDRSRARSG